MWGWLGFFRAWLLLVVLALPSLAFSQNTISTGSIQGTITDISGGLVIGASITITNRATYQKLRVSTTRSGLYSSGALIPGEYEVRIEESGFQSAALLTTVQVGVISPGNIRLRPGVQGEVITVRAPAVQVNTDQATVGGVLTNEQIEKLPINGRKFMDLAQLEPGVQIQDGRNLDPTKIGFIGISFGGRDGSTTRIEVDGVDVTDETVGTTTTGVPSSAIQEFQVGQSLLDLSTELSSGGAVNVVTRSGTNNLHGEAFDFFRDSSVAAALPGPTAPFQRSQFGGLLGGPLVRNQLFFFVDGEHTKQDLFQPVPLPDPFSALSGGFDSPFRETNTTGRLDWQAKSEARFFYRFAYYQDSAATTLAAASFRPINNKDYTTTQTLGVDFETGSFTHSVRFGYSSFRNNIGDAVRGSSLPLASFPVGVAIGPLRTGPSTIAPQATRQSNHQLKYDGGKIVGTHILRYGISYNQLRGGGFIKFFGITPTVFTELGRAEEDFADNSCGTRQPCFPGGRENPLNYPVESAWIGNGQGFLTERPAFGFPAGGLEDNRLGVYAGDSWKIRPNLTVSYGLRYVRDTGRTDSDLPAISAVNAVLPGLGNRVRQPNLNFAPQIGAAWDPWKNGKTVVRAGVGLFYQNVLWAFTVSDRSLRLPRGAFLSFQQACIPGAVAADVPFADGSVRAAPPGACADLSLDQIAIGLAASKLAAFQDLFQSVAASVGTNASNPNYLGTWIASGSPPVGAPYAPNYQTPRSIQINAGVQRELWPGTVITADYLRNVLLHSLIPVDANHTGDANLLNLPAAQAAISATNAQLGCGNRTDAGAIDCAIAAGATIADFAEQGLDSPGDFGVGACAISLGIDCAVAGINPAVGPSYFQFPIGRSVYNALQVKLLQDLNNPLPGLRHLNLQVAYSLSRLVNPDLNPDGSAVDNRDPLRFTGPSNLDRTHQLSFGVVADVPWSFRVGMIAHFFSALPATLSVPNTNLGAGEIFRTDFTGDGTTQDLLPGTRTGSFGRDIKAGELNGAIASFNNMVAGQPTPAGQALIDAGLFTKAQLVTLGAVAPPVLLAPRGEVGLGSLRSFDLRLSWMHTFFSDKLTIEPSVGVFNLLNFANFDLPPATLGGALDGGAGSVNGTTSNGRVANRVGVGSGVFGLGAPRVVEFGLRLTF